MTLQDACEHLGEERTPDFYNFLASVGVQGWGADGVNAGFIDEALLATFLGWTEDIKEVKP